ncbi:MAG: GTPase Era [Gammaproteobacteria bacterium]|nr:GTPase Era [Gammaproteobacteria bacterium]
MKAGYAALIGRPNVGKSTLLNFLLGQKLSITSRRPQTTRHRIIGIKTTEQAQLIYVDTPGIHRSQPKALNRHLNQTAQATLTGVDVVIWVNDSLQWRDDDELVLEKLKHIAVPVIFVINKLDLVKEKSACLPFLQDVARRYTFAELIPVSALKSTNLDALEKSIVSLLPESDLIYPEDQLTDRPERFFISEIIREKLTQILSKELPYSLTIEIELYKETERLVEISAIIWVERDSQKRIVIGDKGQVLKRVGERSRVDIQNMVDRKVFLNLWVKVKSGWADNERLINTLGYHD